MKEYFSILCKNTFLPPKNLHHHFIHSEGMNSLVDLSAIENTGQD
jgi:hypothetical protein